MTNREEFENLIDELYDYCDFVKEFNQPTQEYVSHKMQGMYEIWLVQQAKINLLEKEISTLRNDLHLNTKDRL